MRHRDIPHQTPIFSEWRGSSCIALGFHLFKGNVYQNIPRTIDALKANITEEIQAVTADVLARTFQSIARRVQTYLEANGSHCLHMLWCHISYTMSYVRFKFRCKILISCKIITELPGLVGSGTPGTLLHAWKIDVDRISAWQWYAMGMVRWVYLPVHPTSQPMLVMCCIRHNCQLFLQSRKGHKWKATPFRSKEEMYRSHKSRKKQKEKGRKKIHMRIVYEHAILCVLPA